MLTEKEIAYIIHRYSRDTIVSFLLGLGVGFAGLDLYLSYKRYTKKCKRESDTKYRDYTKYYHDHYDKDGYAD